MLRLRARREQYGTALNKFEDAKKAFYNIDYESVGSKLEEISGLSEKTKKALEKITYPEAINIAFDMNERLDKLQYLMIRSSAVENRAAWYRSSEKSDSEVTAVIEKAAALNINAIYLETWYNGMVIGYSDNKLIKHNKKAHGDFDALGGILPHRTSVREIEIHAWVENFFIGTVTTSQEEDTLSTLQQAGT
jgi:uncharacterized lipoprotein YddW (UPF0748 family)